MSVFDDFVWYDPKKNKIWIGRRDTKSGSDPWDWWIVSVGKGKDGFLGNRVYGPPKHFVEISREPEMTICGGPREL